MRRIVILILLFCVVFPSAVVADTAALPFLAVGYSECVFNTEYNMYSTIFNVNSVSQNEQTYEVFVHYSDATYKEHTAKISSGENQKFGFVNHPDYTPLFFSFVSYDENGVWSGQQNFYPIQCKQRLWIPSVSGRNAQE